jgi:DNA-binding MarR family transcriptional regulator
MNTEITYEQSLVLAFAAAWSRLEKRLDHSLGAIRGISLAEYRLLRALGDAPNAQASRVDLAQAVGLTPSGVTRALRPMEKLGIVSTLKSKRDARLAIAALTPAGRGLRRIRRGRRRNARHPQAFTENGSSARCAHRGSRRYRALALGSRRILTPEFQRSVSTSRITYPLRGASIGRNHYQHRPALHIPRPVTEYQFFPVGRPAWRCLRTRPCIHAG